MSFGLIFFFFTFLKSPFLWYSHSIMSKKIGMVAFRSSASGISVISNIGPTMPGMKQILFWPERDAGHGLVRECSRMLRCLSYGLGQEREAGERQQRLTAAWLLTLVAPL